MSSWLTTVDALGSALSGLATAAAVYFGWKGFGQWKDQLKGTTKYNAALDLLGAAYRLREVFRDVRSSQEEAWLSSRAEAAGREETHVATTTRARDHYYGRLEFLQAARDGLTAAEAQARAACDADVHEALTELYAQTRQLRKTAYVFWTDVMMRARMMDGRFPESAWPNVAELQKAVYQHGYDETESKLAEAIIDVELWADRYLEE